MIYQTIKGLQVTCAMLSLMLFVVRAMWRTNGSAMLSQRWVRILPHVNDSGLLFAAIWMTTQIQQYRGSHGWLTAKVAGLVVYIFIGMVALKYAGTRRARLVALFLALEVFGYIVSVALTRHALPGIG